MRDVYKQLDDAIGSFVSRTRPDDLILFISDHGFQSVTRTIHMDRLLQKFGFLEDADWISGDHRIEGVIVAAGPNVKPFEQPPTLIDLAPTILAALGAPARIEHTGRVLHEVVGSEAKVSRGEGTPAVSIPGMPSGDDASNVSDTEADEMEEHLRGLGCLE